MYAKRLANLVIIKFEDFLYHFPFRYDNFSIISKIANVQEGEVVTVKGKVVEIKNEYTKRAKRIQKAKVKDETGIIDVIWFNQPFLLKSIHVSDTIFLSGKVEKNV
ncbi:MAG: DNA helicase RecG, partial [Candidatus Levybacteria bacterium CG_4_10_14_0_2_um_filter_35_8]